MVLGISKKWIENELVRYVISGGLVTLINAAGYLVLLQSGVVYTIANIASLILSKIAGYILNKYFVYHSKCENVRQAFSECIRFFLARGFTGIIDLLGVVILVEGIGIGKRTSKLILMMLVIVINYILGKKAVFIGVKKESEKEV